MKVFIVTIVGAVFFASYVKCDDTSSESHEPRCENLGGVCVNDYDVCHYYYVFSNSPLCDSCHHCCLPEVNENSCDDIGGYCYDPRVYDCEYFITGLCTSSLIHRCCLLYPRRK